MAACRPYVNQLQPAWLCGFRKGRSTCCRKRQAQWSSRPGRSYAEQLAALQDITGKEFGPGGVSRKGGGRLGYAVPARCISGRIWAAPHGERGREYAPMDHRQVRIELALPRSRLEHRQRPPGELACPEDLAGRSHEPTAIQNPPAVPAGRRQFASPNDAEQTHHRPRHPRPPMVPMANGPHRDAQQICGCTLAQETRQAKGAETLGRDHPAPTPTPCCTRTWTSAYVYCVSFMSKDTFVKV